MLSQSQIIQQRALERERAARRYVVDITASIAHDIKDAASQNKSCVVVRLPTQFTGIGSQVESQCQVWHAVIIDLEKNGYKVKIRPMPDKCLLKISWEDIVYDKYLNIQMAFLAKHTDKNIVEQQD